MGIRGARGGLPNELSGWEIRFLRNFCQYFSTESKEWDNDDSNARTVLTGNYNEKYSVFGSLLVWVCGNPFVTLEEMVAKLD